MFVVSRALSDFMLLFFFEFWTPLPPGKPSALKMILRGDGTVSTPAEGLAAFFGKHFCLLLCVVYLRFVFCCE